MDIISIYKMDNYHKICGQKNKKQIILMTLCKEIETKIKMVVTVVFFDFHLLSHKHVYQKTIQQTR